MEDYRLTHIIMNKLYTELLNKQWITTQKVYHVMMEVDRADFTPTNLYENIPQCIGLNIVISAPLLSDYYLDALKDYLVEGSNALDTSFGSGYLTVSMSKMMNDNGYVVGIEHIKYLYDFSLQNN